MQIRLVRYGANRTFLKGVVNHNVILITWGRDFYKKLVSRLRGHCSGPFFIAPYEI
jgi:hypothetical protein